MIKFKRNLFPSGGRYFIDGDGVRHTADQWEHLIVRVASYRKRNKLPPGDPTTEIYAQACARQPELCADDSPQPVMAAPPPIVVRENAGNLTERVIKWLAAMIRERRTGGARKVSTEEAKRRAAICATCPMQREMSSACGTCKQSRIAAGSALLGTERRVHKGLQACLILGVDTGIAVSLDLPRDNRGELPAQCWRRG